MADINDLDLREKTKELLLTEISKLETINRHDATFQFGLEYVDRLIDILRVLPN